jgi:hypothetical protein
MQFEDTHILLSCILLGLGKPRCFLDTYDEAACTLSRLITELSLTTKWHAITIKCKQIPKASPYPWMPKPKHNRIYKPSVGVKKNITILHTQGLAPMSMHNLTESSLQNVVFK